MFILCFESAIRDTSHLATSSNLGGRWHEGLQGPREGLAGRSPGLWDKDPGALQLALISWTGGRAAWTCPVPPGSSRVGSAGQPLGFSLLVPLPPAHAKTGRVGAPKPVTTSSI